MQAEIRRASILVASLLVACRTEATDEATATDTGATGSATSGDASTTLDSTASRTAGTTTTGIGSTETGKTSATDGDTGDRHRDRIPLFVAQGMIGRTAVSCDDGHTWVADRSWDDEGDPLLCGSTEPVRCWETPCQFLSGGDCATSAPECDCGHHPGFSKGVAYGNGVFVATWGWGYSGSVRTSADGVHWQETLTEDVTFGGLAFGAGRFVLSSRSPRYSTDGIDWMAGQEADFRGPNGEIVWSVRRFAYADYDGGRFVATANPPQAVLVSSDGGVTWWAPSDIPDTCLAGISTYGGIAAADGVIVGVADDGTVCRSTDGGDTWTLGSVTNGPVYGHLLYTGSELVTWGPGVRYTSTDGAQWTSTPTTPSGVWIGPAARSEETGTFVAVSRVWDGYEDQTFLRSESGIDWEVLPDAAFEGGHPIFELTFGYGEPSEVCPAPG